jgi:phage/plasmid-associated DNA primase
VEGCRRWREEQGGLGRPDEILQAREKWRSHSDPSGDKLKEFLNDCCEKKAGALTPTRLVWPAYTDWCDHANVHHRDRLPRDQFATRLEGLGMGIRRTNPKKHRFSGGSPEFAWEGLLLRPQEEEEVKSC